MSGGPLQLSCMCGKYMELPHVRSPGDRLHCKYDPSWAAFGLASLLCSCSLSTVRHSKELHDLYVSSLITGAPSALGSRSRLWKCFNYGGGSIELPVMLRARSSSSASGGDLPGWDSDELQAMVRKEILASFGALTLPTATPTLLPRSTRLPSVHPMPQAIPPHTSPKPIPGRPIHVPIDCSVPMLSVRVLACVCVCVCVCRLRALYFKVVGQ